jgi:hypothetical protein
MGFRGFDEYLFFRQVPVFKQDPGGCHGETGILFQLNVGDFHGFPLESSLFFVSLMLEIS